MARLRCTLCVAIFAGSVLASAAVTPIAKVIELITKLKTEVEVDGRNEATAYNDFACFCQGNTIKYSDSIKKAFDKINLLSADIADDTQAKKDDVAELGERQVKQENLSKQLSETEVRKAKEKAEYEAEAADLSKAIRGLMSAIAAMQDSKASAFIQVRPHLREALEMAAAIGIGSHQKVAALLQQSAKVDPSDPGYDFHSGGIIETCQDLLKDYQSNKDDLDKAFAKSDKELADTISNLDRGMNVNANRMKDLKGSIEFLKGKIAGMRGELLNSEAGLKDDKLFMTDLTARCEARAHDYDQRSAMRGDELEALTTALNVLTKDVAGKTGPRAMFLQGSSAAKSKNATKPPSAATTKEAAKSKQAAKVVTAAKSVSFLQETVVSRHSAFLARGGLSLEARTINAMALLRQEGQRLNSLTLSSLVAKASADPFKKVKGLIQKLIERLLTESQAEASKKGFCDTELGKAETERDYRYQESKDLNTELAGLEAKEDELTTEIAELKAAIESETQDLKDATADRAKEKKANLEAIQTAKEGLEALNEATAVLKSFYKQAAKAAFVQTEHSPVDDDTAGPGFEGNYKGKQDSSKAIFALLDTIASDFDRTLRKTSEAENAAAADYVKFDRDSKSSITAKTTKKELDEEDLKTTKTTIESKMSDLANTMDMLDTALKELEELKPVCIDTGMSYEDRVQKRRDEMRALKKALCILDEDHVEAMCP